VRLRAKDPEAFAWLYDHYAGLLFRIGYSLLRDPSEAEDLVHDVFLGLPRALVTFEGRGSFEGWLKRIATRTGLMKLRQGRTRTTWLQRWGWTVPGLKRPPDADGAGPGERTRQLTPALRAAFVLRDQGYSYEEVADLLGISAGQSPGSCAARRAERTARGTDALSSHRSPARPLCRRSAAGTGGPPGRPTPAAVQPLRARGRQHANESGRPGTGNPPLPPGLRQRVLHGLAVGLVIVQWPTRV
jgi:RNA polymerase sigma-70 factor (ECF subfamily)